MAGRADRREKGGDKRSGLAGAGTDFVETVVAYAKQETLGPLRGVGRFIAAGVSGSIALSIGLLLLLLALLRALQTETGSTFTGNLSWLPYLITSAVALGVLGLSAWRITKTPSVRPAERSDKGEG